MEGFAILFILLAILSGPIALIKVLSLSKKIDTIYQKLRAADEPTKELPFASTLQDQEPQGQVKPPLSVAQEPAEKIETKPILQPIKIPKPEDSTVKKTVASTIATHARKESSLERQIGTKWILIAGVITVFVGVSFFLIYAYENFSLSPMGRIIAVTISGLVALAAGEITRWRGYDIVAKGVTALGFAILYAAVFTAYQFYGLIGFVPAFLLATTITAMAMLYAVVLDEILIAFLSLLGGFLTPILVLSKITFPAPLFIYVLILGVGAMLCAYYRKWRSVNFLSFAGTFLLYTMWFNNSVYSSMIEYRENLAPHQTFFSVGLAQRIFPDLLYNADTL